MSTATDNRGNRLTNKRLRANRIAAIGDLVAECKRRWPDFAFTLEDRDQDDGSTMSTLIARWTDDEGDACAVGALADSVDDARARKRIAISALCTVL